MRPRSPLPSADHPSLLLSPPGELPLAISGLKDVTQDSKPMDAGIPEPLGSSVGQVCSPGRRTGSWGAGMDVGTVHV